MYTSFIFRTDVDTRTRTLMTMNKYRTYSNLLVDRIRPCANLEDIVLTKRLIFGVVVDVRLIRSCHHSQRCSGTVSRWLTIVMNNLNKEQ